MSAPITTAALDTPLLPVTGKKVRISPLLLVTTLPLEPTRLVEVKVWAMV